MAKATKKVSKKAFPGFTTAQAKQSAMDYARRNPSKVAPSALQPGLKPQMTTPFEPGLKPQMTTPFEPGLKPQMTTPFEPGLKPQMTTPFSQGIPGQSGNEFRPSLSQAMDQIEMNKAKIAVNGDAIQTAKNVAAKPKAKPKATVAKAKSKKPNMEEIIKEIEAGRGQKYMQGN